MLTSLPCSVRKPEVSNQGRKAIVGRDYKEKKFSAVNMFKKNLTRRDCTTISSQDPPREVPQSDKA